MAKAAPALGICNLGARHPAVASDSDGAGLNRQARARCQCHLVNQGRIAYGPGVVAAASVRVLVPFGEYSNDICPGRRAYQGFGPGQGERYARAPVHWSYRAHVQITVKESAPTLRSTPDWFRLSPALRPCNSIVAPALWLCRCTSWSRLLKGSAALSIHRPVKYRDIRCKSHHSSYWTSTAAPLSARQFQKGSPPRANSSRCWRCLRWLRSPLRRSSAQT